MKANKVRKTFLDYFKNKNHEVVESSSLIPKNDEILNIDGEIMGKTPITVKMIQEKIKFFS